MRGLGRAMVAAVVMGGMVTAMGAPAEADSTLYRARFSGVGGSTTLSDCPTGPAEVTCHATLVNASLDRSGQGGTSSFLGVQLITVHLHADGTFDYEFGGSGFSETATVVVDRLLASGHASGTVALDGGGTLAVDVAWTATGPLERNGSSFSYHDGCVRYREVLRGATRSAEASGTIGGSVQHSVVSPAAPATVLFSSTGSFVERSTC
jgi:hypothetical protein